MLLQDAVLRDCRCERQLRMATLFVGGILPAYLIALAYFLLPLRGCFVDNAPFPLRLDGSSWGGLGFILVTTVLLCGLLFVASTTIEKLKCIGDEVSDPEPYTSWVFLWLSVLALGLGVVFVVSLWFSDSAITLFTFFRAVDLGDGLSPLTALIFLAIAYLALATCDLLRLSLLEDCYLDQPFQGFNEAASFAGIEKLATRVSDLLKRSPMKLPGAWPICLLWVVGFFWFEHVVAVVHG